MLRSNDKHSAQSSWYKTSVRIVSRLSSLKHNCNNYPYLPQGRNMKAVSELNGQTEKQIPWPLVREPTIPTELPPPVDEIYCQIYG
jgi:hypothetical protein